MKKHNKIKFTWKSRLAILGIVAIYGQLIAALVYSIMNHITFAIGMSAMFLLLFTYALVNKLIYNMNLKGSRNK
jgi:hypothetical protein